MSLNGIPEFDLFDLDSALGYTNLGYGEPSADLTNMAGPSQPNATTSTLGDLNFWDPSQFYTGSEVWSGFSNCPDIPGTQNLTYAPTTLYPANRGFPDEGYCPPSSFYQEGSVPTSLPFNTSIPPPVPTIPYSGQPLPSELYPAPVATTHRPLTLPQAVPNLDSLHWNFLATAGTSSLPVAHPPPTYNLSREEMWRRRLQSGRLDLGVPRFDQITTSGSTPSSTLHTGPIPQGAAPPAPPHRAPIASSSGPERTRGSTKGRRHNPVKCAKKAEAKEDVDEEGWGEALARFQKSVDPLFGVQNGKPSWELAPGMALAKTDKTVKEELERSPLRKELTRCRDKEDYMRGLLSVIRPAPALDDGFDKDETTVGFYERLASELESVLAPVNQQPVLAQRLKEDAPEAGPSTELREQVDEAWRRREIMRVARNKTERERREAERQALERISLLFKVPRGSQTWAKQKLLTLVLLFSLYGPEAFTKGSVKVRPSTTGP